MKFSITELIKCPYFTPVEWFRELAEYGKYAHEEIIERLKEKYPAGEAEVDIAKQFVVDGELVEVRGRIDYLRRDEPIIYEIKPAAKKIPLEWLIQLWFYIVAMRENSGRLWTGRFVLYDRKTLEYKIVKPLIINMVYEEYLVSIIRFRLKNDAPIRGGLCRVCKRNSRCNSRFRFDRYKGVVEDSTIF